MHLNEIRIRLLPRNSAGCCAQFQQQGLLDGPIERRQPCFGLGDQILTHGGRSLCILTLIDEHSRACLGLKVARRINSLGAIDALADAMCLHGIPEHIRCEHSPEMMSKALRKWVANAGAQIQYIAAGLPWENGRCESLDGSFYGEHLRQEIFYCFEKLRS